MSTCCDNTQTPKAKRARCPENGELCPSVSMGTMFHHLTTPWRLTDLNSEYFFCEHSDCNVIYFNESGRIFLQSDLRTPVGLKTATAESMLCYCFGVTYGSAAADPKIREFVVQETRNKSCACEVRNPSGACCLKWFARSP